MTNNSYIMKDLNILDVLCMDHTIHTYVVVEKDFIGKQLKMVCLDDGLEHNVTEDYIPYAYIDLLGKNDMTEHQKYELIKWKLKISE
jgi:hypothetical protein